MLRHDAGTAVMRTRQADAAADADLRERVRRERPAGLRAIAAFAGLDGATTHVCAQWANATAIGGSAALYAASAAVGAVSASAGRCRASAGVGGPCGRGGMAITF